MRVCRICGICLLALIRPVPVEAEPVRFEFEGFVTDVESVQNWFIQPFDRFTGFFEYDLDTVGISAFPGTARYTQSPASNSLPFSLTVDEVVLQPENSFELLIGIFNDRDPNFPGNPTAEERKDVFSFSLTGEQTRATITMSDASLRPLDDIRLPSSFDLEMWDHAQVTVVSPYQSVLHEDGTLDLPGSALMVFGTIDAIRVVPEPSTRLSALIGAATAALIAAVKLFRKGGKVLR